MNEDRKKEGQELLDGVLEAVNNPDIRFFSQMVFDTMVKMKSDKPVREGESDEDAMLRNMIGAIATLTQIMSNDVIALIVAMKAGYVGTKESRMLVDTMEEIKEIFDNFHHKLMKAIKR